MKKIIVVLGQTATGKSALSVKIAKKLNGEIISADSRQVYKGLDIGTGKLSQKDMRGVAHHLLDVANPKRKFSVAEYQKKATSAIADILKRGKTPIICGGTGFYIDAITKGVVFPEVPPDHKLRAGLAPRSCEELLAILKKLDPKRARNIDARNKIRLIRAIEIANALGQVPSLTKARPSYEFIKIGLYRPPDDLRTKVEKRVRGMFEDGLLFEIKRLENSGISKRRLKELGFEYFEPTPEKVISETMKYAKRQMTWWKRDKEIKWFEASKSTLKDILIYLKKMI